MDHGGDLADAIGRYGGDAADWLDLSTGINPRPWPAPARLPEALRGDWTRLPSRDEQAALLASARAAYAVPDHLGIVAAPGTQALIQWLPRLAPPAPVAILGPTYSEHARCWRAAGAPTREIETLGAAEEDAHLVLVNPNNPDGKTVAPPILVAEATRRAPRWTIVDESFADFAPEASVISRLADAPCLVLRSFGKFYGLAGLRLGFAIAPRPIADRIAAALGPWAVAAPALAVGRAALDDHAWADATRHRLAEDADRLDRLLVAASFRLIGGTSLFRLADVGDAARVHARLAARHIWTRSFADRPSLLRFGMPSDAAGFERLGAGLAGTTAR